MQSTAADARLTPLEQFVRDYVETTDGVWDEVEPQVYDVLLPADSPAATAGGVLRMAFDPEALPEHPTAQLASFGTPLIDRLLADALRRGRVAELGIAGLNLNPFGLPERVTRAVKLPAGCMLRVHRLRPLFFPQAVCWFQSTFVSDQKEQEIVPLGIDLHYGRQVRHLERLLDPAHLVDRPVEPLAEIPSMSLGEAYRLARQQALRTVAALANVRARELHERLDRQVQRMTQYYADLRRELEEERARAQHRGDSTDKHASRQQALTREEQLRIAELRQKSALHVHVRLLNLLIVRQPKLLVHAQIHVQKQEPTPLQMVWDPLLEVLEAIPCPACLRPTYEFALGRLGRLECPQCPVAARAPATQRNR
jgi:hypothetical protein